jgi:hypothetical protein
MKDKPCCLLKVVFEKTLFPDQLMQPDMNQEFQDDPKDFLFYGIKNYQVSLSKFLKPEIVDLHPRAAENWELDVFGEYIQKYAIMMRETILRSLKNLTR